MTRTIAWLRRLQDWLHLDRVDLILMLAFVAVVGPWVNEVTAQGSARYLLTAALVEEHSVDLDAYEPMLGVDRVEIRGHVYSDKAPLQPLLGVPILAIAEQLGVARADSFLSRGAIGGWADGNLGAWTQTFAFGVIPAAALIPLIRRHLRRFVDSRSATMCALALVCSTMILAFSSYLYAHVFAAFLSFLAWHILTSERSTEIVRVVTAGTVIALAFTAEYPVIGAIGILALWTWHRHGLRRAVSFGIPSVVALGAVLAWNYTVYGSFSSSYDLKNDSTLTFLAPPKLYNTFEIFIGRRGLIFTPIALLAVVGIAVALWRRSWAVVVPAAMFLYVFLIQAGWPNPWGGEVAQPRYMLLSLPFLAYPLAVVRPRVTSAFFGVLVGLGILSMGLVVTTLELFPDGAGLIGTSLRYLVEGEVNSNLFSLALGPAGWAVYALVAVVAVAAGVQAVRSIPPAQSPPTNLERRSSDSLSHT